MPPTLSPVERRAFRELAQELTSRLRASPQEPAAAESGAEDLTAKDLAAEELRPKICRRNLAAETAPAAEVPIEQVLLDRIPIGVLVYRHDSLLYANRHFLEWTGYANLAAIEAAGGLNTLFAEAGAEALAESGARAIAVDHDAWRRQAAGRGPDVHRALERLVCARAHPHQRPKRQCRSGSPQQRARARRRRDRKSANSKRPSTRQPMAS